MIIAIIFKINRYIILKYYVLVVALNLFIK